MMQVDGLVTSASQMTRPSHDETTNDTDFESGDLTIEVISTLVGINDLTTLTDASFSFIA